MWHQCSHVTLHQGNKEDYSPKLESESALLFKLACTHEEFERVCSDIDIQLQNKENKNLEKKLR